jgi:hypothetical protein
MLIARDAGGENRRIKRVLTILDTCHSGVGVLELSRQLSHAFFQGVTGNMFYLLAAAFPNEEALGSALAKALIESLEDKALGGAQQPLIFFDQLIPAINRRLRAHKVIYCPVLSSDEEPQFFPNPRYVPDLPIAAPVQEIRRVEEHPELAPPWGPRSRGVELDSQAGWYFTGRHRVLQELSQWLQAPGDARTRVVTGSPGSGKTAILSKIVMLSDPE